jgi:hypothetical protein
MVLAFVLAFGVDVPINDDWDLLETSLAWHEQGIDFGRLVAPHNEHFLEYRAIVRREIEEQLATLPPDPPKTTVEPSRELQPV